MYITILFVIIAIVLIILIIRQTELSRALKGFVVTMFSIAIIFAVAFEYVNTKSQDALRPLIMSFKKGDDLKCKNNNINNQTYIYEAGTSSFQPKSGVVGETYSLRECLNTK